jgi:uncharacterized protein
MTIRGWACASSALVLAACAGTFSHPIAAVILGTDSNDGTTTLQLPSYEVSRPISPLGVDPHTGQGDVQVAAVAMRPNHDGKVEVNANSTAHSAGPQWVAGAGLAAVVAAQTLEMDVLDWVFTVETTAYNVDGPSASGLMTAGFLAAATGAQIDSEVTMTGTINPDGTIGPVGGIPEKFDAAIRQGKRTLGFPIGMRYARSVVSGQKVDLVQLAASRGAQAVEVANVRQAYQLLTHKTLPEVVPVDQADMHLDAVTAARLVEQTAALQASMAQRWAVLDKLDADPQTPPAIKRGIERARRKRAASDTLRARGEPAAAHAAMSSAWIDALVVSTLHAIVDKLHGGDAAGASRMLDALVALPAIDQDLFAAIAASPTDTLGRQLRAIEANRFALTAWTTGNGILPQLQAAKAYLQTPAAASAPADDVVRRIEPVVISLCARANAHLRAKDLLALEPAGNRAAASLASVSRSVTAFKAASSAAIVYLDSVMIPNLAESEKLSEDDAKLKLAERNPHYLFAHFADRLASDPFAAQLAHAWGEKSSAWLLLALASAELGYTDSMLFVAEAYGLRVNGDKVEYEEAFAAMLEGAEHAARAAARAARVATGSIPAPSSINYELAAAERDGSTADKLDALSAYWVSALYSQTAMLLARHSDASAH